MLTNIFYCQKNTKLCLEYISGFPIWHTPVAKNRVKAKRKKS